MFKPPLNPKQKVCASHHKLHRPTPKGELAMFTLSRFTRLLVLVSLLTLGTALAGPTGPTTPGLDRTVAGSR